MNRFILSEEEKERILTLHESATKRHYLSEQVNTTHDRTYDYKKEGDKYFYRKKGEKTFKKVSGKSEEQIKIKVFKEKPSTTKVNTTTSKSTTTKSKHDLPFKSKEEGDKFRVWMNKYYPKTSKNLQLDKTGSFKNSYIRKAWNHNGKGGIKGDIYTKQVLSKGGDKSFSFGGGDFMSQIGDNLKKVYVGLINGLNPWPFKPTKGNFVIPFVFPEYEPKIDKGGDSWYAPITKVLFGSSGKDGTYGKLGHAGIAVVLPSGNVSMYEFGRYTGAKKGYGISKSKSLGKIAKMDGDGLITNFKSVSEKIKSNSQGDGPRLSMDAKLVPAKDSTQAISTARKTTSKKYEGFDMDATDNDANCGTYTVEIAKAAGVPLGDFCYPNPTSILNSFKNYSVESVTV